MDQVTRELVNCCQVIRRFLPLVSEFPVQARRKGVTYSNTAIAHTAPMSEEGAYPSPPTTPKTTILPTTPTRYNGRLPSRSPKYHINGIISSASAKPPILMSKQRRIGSPAILKKYMFCVKNAVPIKPLPNMSKHTVKVRLRSVPLKQSK